jgi:leucyl-tRNA synthetase
MGEPRGKYDFRAIEAKWQRFWEQNKSFRAVDFDEKRPKYYVLDMFPYPSAAGLHVGHPEGYTASDIVARYKRMKGFNVLHPMGWDAFGLPAEQYAVSTGTDPAVTTARNIENMRRQIKAFGFSYDWDREVSTADPDYYRWTQWIFLKFYNSHFDRERQKARPIEELAVPDGLAESQARAYVDSRRLAYEAEVPVNWCPALGTVLANEEVVGGLSERGRHPVIRKPMRQWMLRITDYAERLIDDLDGVDWPQSIKKLQVDWIGKSVGADVIFQIEGLDEGITVFTTRPDTLFGATYMVLSPEHELVDAVTVPGQRKAVGDYRRAAAAKSDLDRTDLAKEKTGIFTGSYAINPVNDSRIPIWISDYVLVSYGTGAIMSVPAHDERDFEFAGKFGLPIVAVVKPDRETALALDVSGDYLAEGDDSVKRACRRRDAAADSIIEDVCCGRVCFTGEGAAINSGRFDGLETARFKEDITRWLEENGRGRRAVNYKLRDWLFSRQRYWGEPFPIVRTGDGRTVGLRPGDLPLVLPRVDDYKPAGDGRSPLANAAGWVSVTMPDGTAAARETDTMPQWAGSCWYYLRYLDPANDRRPWDREKEKYWMNVDLYVGGAEHAVLHLLYARFWHKFLYDLGYVSTPEPFARLVNQGMILGEDGQKMSKSRGNVINPDKVIADYGADSIRLYEMFMGPLAATKPWSMRGVEGVHRFLQRLWRIVVDAETGEASESVRDVEADEETLRLLNRTVKKVGDDIESFSFNTAISAMMIFVNHLGRLAVRPRGVIETFLLVLEPFAPHIAEELWERLGREPQRKARAWPIFDPDMIPEKQVELAVQVNGRIRDRLVVPFGSDEDYITRKAMESPKVEAAMDGRKARRIIVVKSRLVNIVL